MKRRAVTWLSTISLPNWQRRRWLLELAFLLLVCSAVLPLWVVPRPPIQDLPQHLAAVRVLHDFADARFNFADYFELALLRTQYLTVYLAAHVLAYPLSVLVAMKLLISVCLVATPYALRALLRATDQDEAASVLALPLTYNAHLVLGFLNFIAAIPLMFCGLALAAAGRDGPPRLRRELLLGFVAVLTFYTHVVPFALLLLGVALLAIERDVRVAARRLLPLVPASLAALLWLSYSPAGQAVSSAAGAAAGAVIAEYQPWGEALRQSPDWLIDVLHEPSDEHVLVLWLLLVLLVFCSGRAAPPRARRLFILPAAAFLAYFVAPASYGWIWPINARFPLLGLLCLVLVVPPLKGVPRALMVTVAALLSLFSFRQVGEAFRHYDRLELGKLEQALQHIPEGQRVAGLVWDRGSRFVKFSPFLHAVAWYQAERGGAVMFSFADFPQSPFVYRESARPPRVPPRWEWLPERVSPDELVWFDYVMTRGGPGRLARSPDWQRVFSDGVWHVFRRRGAQPRT